MPKHSEINSQTTQVKISIIMPVYNAIEFLRESIDSVCNQAFKEWELICVDDGSTDNSLDVLKEFAEKDSRIIVITQKNQGAGVARNNALNKARGEYVGFLDADDMFPANTTLNILYNSAIKHKVSICGGSLKILREDGSFFTDFSGAGYGQRFSNEGVSLYSDYQFDYGYQRFIYKREMLVDNNIVFPKYRRFQDPPFMVKAMIVADKFYHISEPTYTYRLGHKNVNWTSDKVCDLIQGLCDDLRFSSDNRLAKLHMITIYRMNGEYFKIIADKVRDKNVLSWLLVADSLVDYSLLGIEKGTILNPVISSHLKRFEDVFYNRQQLYLDACFIKQQNSSNGSEKNYLRYELNAIHSSASYRIGRFMTYIPRKVRGGIRCYKEHGMGYTMRRVKEKFIGLLGGSKK